jgi:hypothetical protein
MLSKRRRARAAYAGDGAGWWSDGQRVQYGGTCLMSASIGGHMEVVKYLCEVEGKKLLMRAYKVSLQLRAFRHVCVQICSDACMVKLFALKLSSDAIDRPKPRSETF